MLSFQRCFAVLILGLSISTTLQAAEDVDLSGCWSGRWKSHCTGHQGPLTATFCRVDADTYFVKFRGRFFAILPFKYDMHFNVVQPAEVDEHGNTTIVLAGSKYLGRMFGTFHFTATADGCHFRANYHSCEDRGVFTLSR